MSDLRAQEVTGIKKGDTLSEKKLDSAILALYDQGYFKDVYATFDKGELVFHFVEKPRVASLEIKGYGTEQERETLYKPVSYTHLTLPTIPFECRSRWSPYH